MLEVIVQRLTSVFGVPDDQIRCPLLILMCYPLGFIFRHILHPSHTPLIIRHLFSSLTGLTLATLCFGWHVLILIFGVAICYILLLTIPPHLVQRYTMVLVMICLSSVHLHRTLTDLGGWHMDVSGPMMILIQKLSLVAFAVHDGMGGNRKPLNDDQQKQKLVVIPSVLEYMSYCFNFHSILAGPAVTMREHLSFMDGSNLRVTHTTDIQSNNTDKVSSQQEPSNIYPVISKLAVVVVFGSMYLFLMDYDGALAIAIDPSLNIVQRLFYLYISSLQYRFRYYFIFVLNDSVNNAAGLGFEGYDSDNNPKWSLASNVDIIAMETSMNIRQSINAWNITTARWLRRICYERVSWQPTLMTFLLSSAWHGYYPGYYLCLVSFSIMLQGAKKMRQLCRPFFTSHGLVLKWCYHVVTFIATRMSVDYCALAMKLLWISHIMTAWRHYYFIPTIAPLLIILLVPSSKTHKKERKEREEGNNHSNTNDVDSKKHD